MPFDLDLRKVEVDTRRQSARLQMWTHLAEAPFRGDQIPRKAGQATLRLQHLVERLLDHQEIHAG